MSADKNIPATMLDAALWWARRGYNVFPCKEKKPLIANGFKAATRDETVIRGWWTRWPDAQIALPTGRVNGFVVADVDGVKGAAWLRDKSLPETRLVETSPDRFQWWWSLPEGRTAKCSAGVLAEEIDVRGEGGYVIAPPSIHHISGKPYKTIANLPLAPAPEWILEDNAAQTKPTAGVAQPSADVILEGQGRHREILKIAGSLRRHGLGFDVIISALVPINAARCNPPLDLPELERLARYINTKPAGTFSRNGAGAETSAEVELQYYHHVEREAVTWLWPQRIPRGKLTLFVGDPGTGKSLATIDLAARVSCGSMFPDGCPCERGDVLVLTAEDDAHDTVGPRLDAARADSAHVARIHAVKVTLADGGTAESVFNLERDLMKLEEVLSKHPNFKLIIIDPLSAYLGKVNSWRDTEVRALLTPLMEFAMRTGIAVIGIMHMRKSEADAMLRVGGSIAFVAAARCVWGFGTDPDDETQNVMVPVKNNLAPLGNAMAYQIAANENGVPYIAWQTGPRDVNAEDVLGGSKKEKRQRGEKLAEAKEWLKAQLAGGPVAEKQLDADAKKAGISSATLKRAKDSLRVKSDHIGFTGPWYWSLPEARAESGHEDAHEGDHHGLHKYN